MIETLEKIAREVLDVTAFFHNGDGYDSPLKMQNGAVRTNCIDCLDRTNAAQFVIGKFALGCQLLALGVISTASIDYDTDAVNLFTNMYRGLLPPSPSVLNSCRYHNHGDTIAVQYGGSHLVNTMETYRKINQWTSHSRDMVESFKRYYNNSFVDGQRQEAYNLFLGNYIFTQGQPMLWDLSTDYYLHHADPRLWSANDRKSYTKWFTDSNLIPRSLALISSRAPPHLDDLQNIDDYWLEYYRPSAISSFPKLYSFRINSTLRYIPAGNGSKNSLDLSPFRVRVGHGRDHAGRARHKKGVKIVDAPDILNADQEADTSEKGSVTPQAPERRASDGSLEYPRRGILKDLPLADQLGLSTVQTTPSTGLPKDKSATTQWTFNQFVLNSLSPVVSASELAEYGRYISHPQNLPLVLSINDSVSPRNEFLSYLESDSSNFANQVSSESLVEYSEYLDVEDEPLTVGEGDAPKKRYKAYRQWLKGKSLFKQPRTDL